MGQLVEMLICVLFSLYFSLLPELPETSLLSCLKEGSAEEREEPAGQVWAKRALDHLGHWR